VFVISHVFGVGGKPRKTESKILKCRDSIPGEGQWSASNCPPEERTGLRSTTDPFKSYYYTRILTIKTCSCVRLHRASFHGYMQEDLFHWIGVFNPKLHQVGLNVAWRWWNTRPLSVIEILPHCPGHFPREEGLLLGEFCKYLEGQLSELLLST